MRHLFLIPIVAMMVGVAHAESCKTGSSAVTLPDGVSPTMGNPISEAYSDPSGMWSVTGSYGFLTISKLKNIMSEINSSDPITGIYGYYGYRNLWLLWICFH